MSSTTYGSEPLAYDFDAALTGASSTPSKVERVYDVANGERSSAPAAIVGLFDSHFCRRCEAVFEIDEEGRREHREWHEWLDANQAISKPAADELAFHSALRPLSGYKPDEGRKVVPLRELTRAKVDAHRTKFEPKGQGFSKARSLHREACDSTAERFGLTADSVKTMVLELRRDGLDVAEIAERVGVTEKRIRALLAS